MIIQFHFTRKKHQINKKMSTPKEKLIFALANTESSEEMVKIFNKMEKSTNPRFSETELDVYCSFVARKLHIEGKDFEKVLSFGKRGLKYMLSEMGKTSTTKIPCFGDQKFDLDTLTLVFREDGCVGSNSSIVPRFYHLGMESLIPDMLNLLGSVCCKLRRFNESLSYYDWSVRNLTKLLKKDCPDGCYLKKLEETERGLFYVKQAMGRAEEALPHVKKVLECKEKRLKEGCLEIGKANKDVYEAYFAAIEVKEGLPYCLKALEIYRKHFGVETAEVANILSNLGTIYRSLGDHEKAREQDELAKSVLRKVAPDSPDLVGMEIGEGDTLLELGRYKEAIEVFRDVVEHIGVKGIERARAFGGMANASLSLGKFADAKKFIRAALRIYEKGEMDPLYAAVGFEDFSKMYEKMNDLETAITFVRRALNVPKLPEKLLIEASWRLLSLYSLAGKEEEGIPYMEDAIEKLKECFGPEHLQVGYAYGKLGLIYTNSTKEELGVKLLEKAKEIMDVTLGPNHLDSLITTNDLALTYSRLRRVDLAIDLEKKVIAGCRGLGSKGQALMSMAVVRLNKFEEITSAPEWAMISAFADQAGIKFGFGKIPHE